MKILKFLIFILIVIFSACKHSSKTNSNIAVLTDSSMTVMDTPVVTPTQPVKGKLNVNTMFFDGSGTSYTYIINEKYCILNTTMCSYTYDRTNGVIAINYAGIMKDQADAIVYYEVESGYNIKNRGYDLELNISKIEQNSDLNSNLSNQTFALVQMDLVSAGHYQVRRDNSDRLRIYKPLEIDKILDDYKSYIYDLKESLNAFNQSFLITENKIDILKNIGDTNVDATLANKVDYTYALLLLKWEKINRMKNKIDLFLNSDNDKTSKIYKPEIFTELILNMVNFKQLKINNEDFNKLLDNEILPIINPYN